LRRRSRLIAVLESHLASPAINANVTLAAVALWSDGRTESADTPRVSYPRRVRVRATRQRAESAGRNFFHVFEQLYLPSTYLGRRRGNALQDVGWQLACKMFVVCFHQSFFLFPVGRNIKSERVLATFSAASVERFLNLFLLISHSRRHIRLPRRSACKKCLPRRHLHRQRYRMTLHPLINSEAGLDDGDACLHGSRSDEAFCLLGP